MSTITFKKKTESKSYSLYIPTFGGGSQGYAQYLREFYAAHGPGAVLDMDRRSRQGGWAALGTVRLPFTSLTEMLRCPEDIVRHAIFHGAGRVTIAWGGDRVDLSRRESDIEGTARLKDMIEACGIDFNDVYLVNEEGSTGLKRRIPSKKYTYRRGKHTAPEAALEGPYGEEVAAIYDVMNRSTVADCEALTKAAEVLARTGLIECDLPEEDRSKVEALREYAAEADPAERVDLLTDYTRQAAFYVEMARALKS